MTQKKSAGPPPRLFVTKRRARADREPEPVRETIYGPSRSIVPFLCRNPICRQWVFGDGIAKGVCICGTLRGSTIPGELNLTGEQRK